MKAEWKRIRVSALITRMNFEVFNVSCLRSRCNAMLSGSGGGGGNESRPAGRRLHRSIAPERAERQQSNPPPYLRLLNQLRSFAAAFQPPPSKIHTREEKVENGKSWVCVGFGWNPRRHSSKACLHKRGWEWRAAVVHVSRWVFDAHLA